MTRFAKNIAVIGCGGWGQNIVRSAADAGLLYAVSDTDSARAQGFADKHGVKNLSFDDALADAAVAGVMLAVPAPLHAAMTLKALAAGKHVFVEKPIAMSVADAQDMTDAATKAQRVLMVGHLLHYHPAFIALKALVADGTLGTLRHIHSNRLNFGRVRTEENVFWSFAPHDVSMMLALAGREPVGVDAIYRAELPESGLASTAHAHFDFGNGLTAHIHVSWFNPFKEQKLVVTGSRAMAVFDDTLPWDKKLTLYKNSVDFANGQPQLNKGEATAIALEAGDPLKDECLHFAACMADGTAARTDGLEGLRVLKTMQACDRAAGVAPMNDYFIHESAYVDDGCAIGTGSKIWHFAHVLAGTTIGQNCIVGQNAMVGPDVKVGDGCKIQNNVSLYKGVTLEADVFCGPSCVFTNVLNPRAHVQRKDEFKPTLVKRGATIGANATIVCGHTLGEYCMIGAGAVVTHDVPAHALMVGVPARRTGWVSHDGEILGPDLTCPRTGRRYIENNGTLKEV